MFGKSSRPKSAISFKARDIEGPPPVTFPNKKRSSQMLRTPSITLAPASSAPATQWYVQAMCSQ